MVRVSAIFMDDKQAIQALYEQMYQAMIAKDIATLDQLHADDFVLTHMTGQSRVLAAVFGGGKHTWPLQLRFTLRKEARRWRLTSATASTY